MTALEHKGFFPLTPACIDATAPPTAGVYTLAVRLPNGVHKTFFTTGTENLRISLIRLSGGDQSGVSAEARGYLSTYRCYFTYFVIPDPEQREAVTKMLSLTCDPISQLTMISCT